MNTALSRYDIITSHTTDMYKQKDSRYQHMIQSHLWRSLRHRKLSESPLCEMCLDSGQYVSAQCVHHIQPCESASSEAEMRRLMFAWNNLQSLCNDCHQQVHRELQSRSKKVIRERNTKKNERFINRFLSNSQTRGVSFFFRPRPRSKSTATKSREIFGS